MCNNITNQLPDTTSAKRRTYPVGLTRIEIPLESNNSQYKQDVFLDLDIQASDNGFTVIIYHATDDFNFN